MKFEKGQRVRRIGGTELLSPGTIGTIKWIDRLNGGICVDWDNGLAADHYDRKLLAEGLVEPADPGSVPPGKPVAAEPAAKLEPTPTDLRCLWVIREHGELLGRGFECCGKERPFTTTSTCKPANIRIPVGYARVALCDKCGTIHLGAMVGDVQPAPFQNINRENIADVKGERDTLRATVQRLERSLDLAQARLAKRR